jgi:hypothetical protein
MHLVAARALLLLHVEFVISQVIACAKSSSKITFSDGGFSFGSKEGGKTTISSGGKCVAASTADAWATSTSLWHSAGACDSCMRSGIIKNLSEQHVTRAVRNATISTCNGDTGAVGSAFDGVASAYAKVCHILWIQTAAIEKRCATFALLQIALSAQAKRTTFGDAEGCALATAEADAQAAACFEAIVYATATASDEDCPCMVKSIAKTFVSARSVEEVWARVWGAVDAGVCTKGA